jgi:hypothetical protein
MIGISYRFGRRALNRGALIAAAGALAATALAAGGSALASGQPGKDADRPVLTAAAAPADGYQFVQIGSHKNRAYNRLLGINDNGRIVGYRGSGADKADPSLGYTITAPYAQGDIKGESFPKSVQSQVNGLNNKGVQVGFYVTSARNQFGWYFNGSFHKVEFPTTSNYKPIADSLQGVNDHDVAVGYYANSAARARGFTFNIKTGKFAPVTMPGAPTGGKAPSLQANAINNAGDVAGAYTNGKTTDGFLKLAGGGFHTIAVPGALFTDAFGVNNNDTVVGTYEADDVTHGFIWRIGSGFSTNVDDPNAVDFSEIDGINNEGDIVGLYVDSADRVDGFLAYPAF